MASRRRLQERFAFASHAVHVHRRSSRPVLEVLEGRVVLSSFTVNSLGDAGNGSGLTGDLRYCINQANADHQANTIVFDSTLFSTPQTITLSGQQLELEDTAGTQTITGPSAGVTISGGGKSRVFQIDRGVTASISGLTINGGSVSSADGGGLANFGKATLTGCTVSNNSAPLTLYSNGYGYSPVSGAKGGGVYNAGTANLIDCTLRANSAGYGGGLFNQNMATLTGCTISGNSAYFTSGAYYFNSQGGGVYNAGTANLTNCTVSGNTADEGVQNSGNVSLTACTLSGNSVRFGALYDNGNATASLTDTIVAANNLLGSNGTTDIGGYGNVSGNNNLIGTGGSGPLVNGVDGNIVLTSLTGLGLAPLGSYGGPTQTIALLPGSPAFGPGTATRGITTDQRGEPLDSPPCIGAFQSQGFTLSPLAGSTPQQTTDGIPFANPLAVIVTANNPLEPVAGGTVAFTAPLSGASALLEAGTATIGSDGSVSVLATDNSIAGSYTVTASTTVAASVSFSLTNLVSAPVTIYTVNSTSDGFSGSGTSGTLPYVTYLANADANPSSTGTEIDFDPSVFSTPQAITLSTTLILSDTAAPVMIDGPGSDLLTVSGGATSRVFEVDSGVTASISGLTISGGSNSYGKGGGLANYGEANLTDCIVSGNTAKYGGGVYNAGTANLTDCTVSGNTGSNGGGGVANAGTANLTHCTFAGNSVSTYSGGGLSNLGTATLFDCTFTGNVSGFDGGGLSNLGTATLFACTLTGNSSYNGGYGDQLLVAGLFNNGTASLTDTIVAGNTNPAGASDIGGYQNVSGSYNLIGIGGSAGLANGVDGNIVLTSLTDLGLTPLGNYGGPTQTIALLPGSPAVGAGTAVSGITTDQRGEPLDSPPDIGAFQTHGFTLSPVTGSTPQQTTRGVAFVNPLAVIVTANNPLDPVAGGTVTFTAPSSGPSAVLEAATATIGSDGSASIFAVDNSIAGSYTVTASTTGAASVSFSLTNLISAPVTAYTVNSTSGGLTGSGTSGTLPYVTLLANADANPSSNGTEISFDPSVFSTPQTITLGTTLILSETAGPVVIDGPRSGLVNISGGGTSRVFKVDNGVTASISGLTISGGSIWTGYGGGLANYGTSTLTDCILSGNTAFSRTRHYGYGGSVSTTYYGSGGGVSNSGAANLTLTDCTVSGNNAASGGGVFNSGTVTLTDCTIGGNTAKCGGGLDNSGTANLTDCTISGDTSGAEKLVGYYGNTYYGPSGGGVFNSGTANLTNCTVSGNSSGEQESGYYGGTYFEAFGPGGGIDNSRTVNMTDTIVAGNSSDIEGNVSGSYNLIGTGGSGGLTNGANGNIVLTSLNDLGLASLGNNGGPTQTMALLPGSPAIGAGVIADYAGTSTPITTDQRGEPLDSPNPDIGAFQTQGSTLVALAFSGISDQSITYGASGVTVSGTLANGSQAPVGESVAVTLDGVEQPATIGSGGAFSTTFHEDGLAVGSSPYTVSYAYSSDGSFASESTTSMLTVKPATLTITASLETKVYGTSDPALAYTASGFQLHDTAASVLTGEQARAQAGTLAGEQAGGYAISQGTLAADGNYTIAFTGSTLSITPATLTVTANSQTKVYGTDDPALTDSATGFVDTTVDGVTIDDTAATTLSGGLARSAGETVSGGPYAITQGTLAADSNYTITFTGSTLTITPAPLTVTANPQTKVYGTSDPSLTDSVTGLVDTTVDGVTIDDTTETALTGQLARTPGETVSGGPYAITKGTLAASNYTITFTGSTLTITPAPLTVTANPQTKVYGTSDPSLTDSVTGLVDTTVDGVTIDDTTATALTGQLARTPGETVSGGPYAITQGTLAADSNYTISFTGNTLTITPAPLTITANPQTKVYGTDDPALTDTATGFVDTTVDGVVIDDTAATALTGQLARTPGETVSGGPYAITQGTLAADSNYTLSFTAGTLTNTPATLTVTANPQTKVYGTTDPALTDTATGFVDTTVDGVTIDDTAATALTGQLARTPGETVAGGPYAITQGTLAADSNYTLSFTGSTLAITPATLTVTANPETKVFGSADPVLAYTAGGFQFDDTAATVLSGHLTRAAGQTVAGGPYAITQGTLAADANYTIQFTASTLTITRATPVVTESAPGGTYTGAPIAATASVTGVGSTATPNLEGVTPTLTYFAGSGTSGTNLGSTAPSAAGTYTVVARFPGSADFAPAQSKPTTFTITPATTTIVLQPHAVLTRKKVLKGVELTATIEPVALGGGVPTGTVTFEFVKKQGKKVKVTTLGTAPLSGGTATLTFKPNKVLNQPLVIVYSGDPDFLASTMSPIKLTKSEVANSRI